MTYKIVSSGSQGNATIINDSILIDCGVPFKSLRPYIHDLGIVLLTHIHGDHFNPATVRALHRERPALRWGCGEWMVEPLVEAGVSPRVIDVFTMDKVHAYVTAGGGKTPTQTLLQASATVHDVPNCCYRLQFPNGEKLFYATDCATLDGIHAEDFDLYMIEANHTKAEIEARISEKQAAGEFAYEVRAERNHLSQEQAIDWLVQNAGANSRYVFMHQHKERKINAE